MAVEGRRGGEGEGRARKKKTKKTDRDDGNKHHPCHEAVQVQDRHYNPAKNPRRRGRRKKNIWALALSEALVGSFIQKTKRKL